MLCVSCRKNEMWLTERKVKFRWLWFAKVSIPYRRRICRTEIAYYCTEITLIKIMLIFDVIETTSRKRTKTKFISICYLTGSRTKWWNKSKWDCRRTCSSIKCHQFSYQQRSGHKWEGYLWTDSTALCLYERERNCL